MIVKLDLLFQKKSLLKQRNNLFIVYIILNRITAGLEVRPAVWQSWTESESLRHLRRQTIFPRLTRYSRNGKSRNTSSVCSVWSHNGFNCQIILEVRIQTESSSYSRIRNIFYCHILTSHYTTPRCLILPRYSVVKNKMNLAGKQQNIGLYYSINYSHFQI